MPEFYNPERGTLKHGADLPHWQQGEVMQFVTFRLADSIPETKMRQWKDELAVWKSGNPKPWSQKIEKEYHQHFWNLESWLDDGYGTCIFNHPAKRGIHEETLMHDEGTKVNHHAWVIMPNHVHLIFTPLAI